jgi:hypothetical protein
MAPPIMSLHSVWPLDISGQNQFTSNQPLKSQLMQALAADWQRESEIDCKLNARPLKS